ncbi:hypothetical protein [Mycobacterium sp. 29Ha]|uniref:hypothetical protein n=1 Tax=Mycobacterium sp. 29Ha TaxID=2939268 RepID=UPI002938D3B2|nr:hypothetical protein [Mycobacterium sp. 29Ha]MDV3135719.1 hypothetical protein [Mycobacterium sp. 29Ha]
MTKWPAPTGVGKSASHAEGPTFGSTAMFDRTCRSYLPGHGMHWIHGKKSFEDGQPVIRVKVVAVNDDGQVDIEGDDLELTLWHHNPHRLRSAFYVGGIAEWMPKYHVLYVISSASFNLASLEHVRPCKS